MSLGEQTEGRHFSCSMTAVLVARVEAYSGQPGVQHLLELAGSARSVEYLCDTGNWISYDEAVALWRAGAQVTHHPQFARRVGEDAAERLGGSPVAALLRSLGSPENVYREMAKVASRYTTVSRLETIKAGPGHAEIVATAVEGFPRAAEHCAWSCGQLSQTPVLFGLQPSHVEHDECAAFGAPRCVYRLTWNADPADADAGSPDVAGSLRVQLNAMHERMRGMFATAADLIGADEIDDVLARITDRAAVEVRAQRYLLAVRIRPDGSVHCLQKGFDPAEADDYAAQILEQHPAALPPSWLVVPVRSTRRDYGRLLAMYDDGRGFFPQERELLEVYARYAASALDSATALMEANERYAQSSALLSLARALAAAGTSSEVARRLAEAVPMVVDCDRVGVYLWDAERGRLVRHAISHSAQAPPVDEAQEWSRAPSRGGVLERLLHDPQLEPMFIDADTGDPTARELFAELQAVSSVLVPLATSGSLLGLLAVSVMNAPERLAPDPDLLDRLSGVAAQATTALLNGHLVDQITYQAEHDSLTGLANRMRFSEELRLAVRRARRLVEQVAVFYLDLDGFKAVNDELGHDVGDELLVAISERLNARTRKGDTAARLGGDEFAVLVDADTAPPEVARLQERIEAAFAHPFVVRGQQVEIRASIGCAVFPQDAESPEALLRTADEAMFRCKRAHRARLGGRQNGDGDRAAAPVARLA